MLAKDRTNLKIEEIRMHKHHEIHRVKLLSYASFYVASVREKSYQLGDA